MFSVRVGLLLLLTSVFAMPVVSQQRDQKPKKPSSKPAMSREAEELRLSATSLLHSLAQSANEIENINERVRIIAEIGDAFWLIDPEQARTTLVRAFKEIDKLSLGSDNDPERLATQKRTLRRLVLARIAKHEPPLANELIHDLPKEIATADERAMQQQGVSTPNADALLSIAEGLIAKDPKQAAAIAGYSLQDGLSQRLRLFLMRLRAKDSAAADSVAGAALREAAMQHPGRLFDVMVLWDYAYQPRDFYFNDILWTRNNEPHQNTSLDLKRFVLAFAVNAIVENLQQLPTGGDTTQNRNLAQAHLASLHAVIQQLIPSMQADWPKGITDLQQALARVEQELKTNGQSIPTRPPVEDAGAEMAAVDALIEKAAATTQGDARDDLYMAAAFKLLQMRQFEKGKEIAARIDNAERRAMIAEPLDFRLAGEFVEKNRLQDALTLANQLKTAEMRIASLARIGRAFIESGDSPTGLQTLNTAQSAANKTEPTIEASAATLRIASAFSKNDPERTSEVITLAIQILNKVKQDDTAWAILTPFANEDALALSWKNVPGGGMRSIKAAYPRNGSLADLLSRLDFNQAVSLAKTVNKKTLSLAAQASVCRAALESINRKSSATSSN